MKDDKYYYKISRVRNIEYLQIWERIQSGRDKYILSLGSARQCLDRVVQSLKLQKQTTENP